MGTYEQTRDTLETLVLARTSLIVLRTVELRRAATLVAWFTANPTVGPLPVFMYTPDKGLSCVRSRVRKTKTTALHEAITTGGVLMRRDHWTTLAFLEPGDLSVAGEASGQMLGLVKRAEQHQCTVLIVTDQELWEPLATTSVTLHLDLPTLAEMERYLTDLLVSQEADQTPSHRGSFPLTSATWRPRDTGKAAEILVGLTENRALQLMYALTPNGALSPERIPMLMELKAQSLDTPPGLAFIPAQSGQAVVYMPDTMAAMTAFPVADRVLEAFEDGRDLGPQEVVILQRDPRHAQDLAHAVAQRCGFPLYRLDPALFWSGAGNVAKQPALIRAAIGAIHRASPCVLWVDLGGPAESFTRSNVSRFLLDELARWRKTSSDRVVIVVTAEQDDFSEDFSWPTGSRSGSQQSFPHSATDSGRPAT